jgi:hypothetical protein
MTKRWIHKPEPDALLVEELSSSINVNKTLSGILVQRGIHHFDTAKNFSGRNMLICMTLFL